MSKEQDNMIKKALAKAMDCETYQVKDFKEDKEISENKKTKKEKKLLPSSEQIFIDSGEGLILTDNETKYIDFTDIKGRRRSTDIEKHIFDWDKPRDFVMFIFELYRKKFKTSLRLRIPAACVEVNKLRDDLYDLTNISTPLITRDYIVFYFDKFASDVVRKEGKLYFSCLRDKYHLSNFASNYNYKDGLQREFDKLRKGKEESPKNVLLKKEEMEEGYSLSKIGFLCDYGIVIAVNWLVEVRGRDIDVAIKEVLDTCLKIKEDGAIGVLQEVTEKFSPYPFSLVFKRAGLNLLTKEIDANLQLNVVFSKSEDVMLKFNFIMKGENG